MEDTLFKEKIAQFQKLYDESSRIVFFGGAGVSTESGIPDFRSQDGLYNQKWRYPPEVIISRSFFDSNPEEFYRFYREKLIVKNVQPNTAHNVLAKMESLGKLSAVVTQNIDGLHQAAGSKNVFELHGSVLRNYCMKCGAPYNVISNKPAVEGKCDKCGGELIQRADDNPDTIKNRLNVYHEQTEPIKAYYEKLGLLVTAQGEERLEDTTSNVAKALGLEV